jgi:hypothetical protein
MLTLMKQARAFGLGVVLATQNPVDLDYKGLSNAGTWFLGRLQTERDKARVLEGLEGASAAAGAKFDRGRMEQTLAGLGNRVFLMNNVHEDEPVVFQSRWALSFLRGPVSREQISLLMQDKKTLLAKAPKTAAPSAGEAVVGGIEVAERPVLPPGITELFLHQKCSIPAGSSLVYRPQLLGEAKVHFVDTKSATDVWEDCTVRIALEDTMPDNAWDDATLTNDQTYEYETEPVANAKFANVPAEVTKAKTFSGLTTKLKEHLYRDHRLPLIKAEGTKKLSQPGESEGDYRARLSHDLKELRDEAINDLRKKYATKIATLQEQIRKSEQKIFKEKEQATSQTWLSIVTFSSSVLGALFGRKLATTANIGKAATSVRSASKIFKERQDVGMAEESHEVLLQRMTELEATVQAEIDAITEEYNPEKLKLEPIELQPRKTDISVSRVALLWTPWLVGADGKAIPCEGS